jgi:hypothetical protein
MDSFPLNSLALFSMNTSDMPQGVALNNLKRQLDGSFGMATVNAISRD